MRYRQVHLDFHTGEAVPDVGAKFDKKQFQQALIAGHVDSVTLFSKCHHGWSYHPTKANVMHPSLSFDLLGAQIEAAHEIGVKTPVYLSAGFDEKYARTHQNELVRNRDQSIVGMPNFSVAGYHKLCLNTPYLDTLLEQIKEVLRNYDADGIFLDIICVQPCYCQYCMNELIAEGKSPDDASAVYAQAERVYASYTKKVREAVDSVRPGLPVFHNAGHLTHGRRDIAAANTHLELESLPTGGWGYDHFPLSAAYARTLGMDFLGMTGKFHKSWGEFGGFKHPNALRYEASLSVANGAGCSIGDQLHPSGEMDMATYTLIGEAYAELEKKEPFLKGAVSRADIAVLSTEAVGCSRGAPLPGGDGSNTGCVRILLEGHYLFNYVDEKEDLGKYKVLILPDVIPADAALTKKLRDFVAHGGKVLASGTSAVTESGAFAVDLGCLPAEKSPYVTTYCRPRFDIPALKNSAYVMFSQTHTVKDVTGEILADCENPYFNRSVEHFCSHFHTPNDPTNRVPGIVRGKDGIYVGWEIFKDYAEQGGITAKQIICHLLDLLLPEPSVKTSLPAQGVVTLTGQAEENRLMVHLLYASPVKRGAGVEVIEDILPVYDIEVAVRAETSPKEVTLAPQGEKLPFRYEDGYVRFVVPRLECHQMVALAL